MTVRPVRKSQYENLKALFSAYYAELDCEDDAEEIFRDMLLPDLEADLLSVAVAEDGALCGFIVYQIDDVINDWCFNEGWGDLRETYVSPSSRNRGVGRALVAFAERHLKSQGAQNIYALPTEESEAFFSACGYSDCGDYCAELDNKVFAKNLQSVIDKTENI